MRSFAIVIRRAYFEAKKRRNYAKNVEGSSKQVCYMSIILWYNGKCTESSPWHFLVTKLGVGIWFNPNTHSL